MRIIRLVLAFWVIIVISAPFISLATEAYVWHQIEKQAVMADMVEGAQE